MLGTSRSGVGALLLGCEGAAWTFSVPVAVGVRSALPQVLYLLLLFSFSVG